MTHTPFEESVGAYALGALDANEQRAFEAHLESCPKCAAELADLRRVSTGLAMSVEPIAPPQDLKARTIARATNQPQARRDTPVPAPPVSIARPPHKRSSLPWLAAAAGIAVAVAAGIYAWTLRSELRSVHQLADSASAQADRLRVDLVASRQDAAKLTRTLSVLGAPDVVRVDLKGQGDLATAAVQVYWSAARGLLVLNAGNMPALQNGRVFELWAVPPGAGAQPLAAGLFTVDAAGTVTTVAPPPAVFPVADAFAITIEPSGGSPQATTPIILLGKVRRG
jgi:anti-sigma-K factor RskA